ncbi:MAG TPA: Nudix family hydrolase [Rhodocyclaceae bacterium]|nr:Nudix family hydrolase [Rhodocyclaceae bacterium]
MTKWVDVAAAVIIRADGRVLLGRRAEGTFYPGYWEFPGGKVEPGESPAAALTRELEEELGIRVRGLRPWIVREHVYEHASVRLHFFEVTAWHGEINDHVHSALSWEQADQLSVAPMLPANGPVLKALRLPRFMGVTQAAAIGGDRQLACVEAALARGLRLIQVREPELPPTQRAAFAAAVVERARAHAGALVMINGDVELAARVGADGVHLRGRDLASLSERPPFEWVGASCHDYTQLQRAIALGADYALLGPVKPTLTHPGQAALGWARFAELVGGLPLPVLAIGGLHAEDMDDARLAGAHGLAAIRGAWGAPG